MIMDTEEELKYWPEDLIPVISKPVLAVLTKDEYYMTGQTNFVEYSMILKLSHKEIKIPKYLTSKEALAFLGLNPSRVKELWQDLNSNPELLNRSNIESGKGFYVWKIIIKFLEKKSNITEHANYYDRAYSKKVLDDIGLTNEAQLRDLKIKTGYGEAILNLQAQIPKDAIFLAKQYIKHRWEMLAQLEFVIAKRKNWREDVLMRFIQQPFDLTTFYPPESNYWEIEESLILDDKIFDRAFQ